MKQKERQKRQKRHHGKMEFLVFVVVIVVVFLVANDWMTERRLSALRDEPKTLIYEMYPSSWKGGLPAMTKHLDRVAALDVDYVWLAPCYPSGGVDGGYDVTDYIAIDPTYGTLDDFDEFVRRADELGIKIIMDLVLNHTSDQHEWFKKSVKGEEPYADYYLWSDKDLGWGTMFDGSSAFQWHAERGEYYCHIYNVSQPDLNWDNPAVVEEFQRIIDFWTLDHNVAGFRIDSAQLIGKDFSKTLLPRDTVGTVAGLLKFYQKPKTPEILEELFGQRDLFTFGEMTSPTKGMFNEMVNPDGPLTAGFNLVASNSYDKVFGFVDIGAGFAGLKPSISRLEKSLKKWAKHPSFIAMLESHDVPRFTTRAGIDGEEALEILFGSKARIVCLYQGQELGLENPELSDDIADYRDIQTIMRYEAAVEKGEDPEAVMAELKAESRDNARVPIDLKEYKRQEKDQDSCLQHAKEIIKVWKEE